MEQGHWDYVAVAKTEEQAGGKGQTVLADLKARGSVVESFTSCLFAPLQ